MFFMFYSSWWWWYATHDIRKLAGNIIINNMNVLFSYKINCTHLYMRTRRLFEIPRKKVVYKFKNSIILIMVSSNATKLLRKAVNVGVCVVPLMHWMNSCLYEPLGTIMFLLSSHIGNTIKYITLLLVPHEVIRGPINSCSSVRPFVRPLVR